MTGTEDACQSGGVMNLGQSLCSADVSLTDLIKRWSVALARMGAVVGGARVGVSALKGIKVPPKYRGPSGETWAGRGAKPRWLVEAIKGGKKLDDFLIDKGRKKRRAKR